jgi:predicted dehydrogenase
VVGLQLKVAKIMHYSKTHVALVGYGYWGRKIYQVLRGIRNLSIWVDDLNIADLTQDLILIKWKNLLEEQDKKIVFLATPEETHYSLTKELLLNQKHVFVEKPLALNVKDVQKLMKLAQIQKNVLYCDYTFLFDPYVKKIRELISEGKIGKIKKIHSYRHSKGFQKPEIEVGDDLLIHDLYLGELFFNSSVSKAEKKDLASDSRKRSLSAKYSLYFNDDQELSSWCSWVEDTPRREMTFTGDKGSIHWQKLTTGEQVVLVQKNGTEIKISPDQMEPALNASIKYFFQICEHESESERETRYASYIRHTAMLESVREYNSSL